MGLVIRTLRVQRGLALEELARLVAVSAPNLSRTERGLQGGVHPRHLDRIAAVLGTSASAMYALAEAIAEAPQLLERPEEFLDFRDRLAAVERAYAKANPELRAAVDELLGI